MDTRSLLRSHTTSAHVSHYPVKRKTANGHNGFTFMNRDFSPYIFEAIVLPLELI